MQTVRTSQDRGHLDHGWLDTYHTFSFGQYQDPDWMGFRSLRVINEDIVAPRMGFGEHGHRDMEIITYPVSGAVRHRDSLGHEEDITPGMIQLMRAGSGIRHSEFNPEDEPLHLLQIWITPRERGLEPMHASKAFPVRDEPGRLHLLVSPDGEAGSLEIEQDAWLFAGTFGAGANHTHGLGHAAHGWVQIVRGRVRVNGELLGAGDAIAFGDSAQIDFGFEEDSELLVFELA